LTKLVHKTGTCTPIWETIECITSNSAVPFSSQEPLSMA